MLYRVMLQQFRKSLVTVAAVLLLVSMPACTHSAPDITRISLQRTACFGICPVYTVAIYPDGLVEFHGERFVESEGDFRHRVDPDAFARLAAFAADMDFFGLQEEYRFQTGPGGERIVVSDLPSRITTVEKSGRSKSVLNYFGGPELLAEFETLIDQLSGTARWIGQRSPSL